MAALDRWAFVSSATQHRMGGQQLAGLYGAIAAQRLQQGERHAGRTARGEQQEQQAEAGEASAALLAEGGLCARTARTLQESDSRGLLVSSRLRTTLRTLISRRFFQFKDVLARQY
jgi:hypothetical protein